MKLFLVFLLCVAFTEGHATEENSIFYKNTSPQTHVKDSDNEIVIDYAMRSIMEYLSAHPNAADTIEGIHFFWINWPNVAESIQITQIALENLERMGYVQKMTFANRILWRKA